MINKISEVVKELEYNFNGNRRYQTIIFITDTPTTIVIREIQEFTHAVKNKLEKEGIPCEIVDFLKDVVYKGEFLPGDTGNSFNELIDWVKIKTKPPQRCLLIYEIDPLFSTWNNSDIKAFLKKVLFHDGIRMPILLISHMAGRFSLPTATSGQGLIIKQSDEETL